MPAAGGSAAPVTNHRRRPNGGDIPVGVESGFPVSAVGAKPGHLAGRAFSVK